jgi:hypothetical protein
MAYNGRGSLPANYADFAGEASQALVLPTPQPQFTFAHWAMAGRVSAQALDAGMTVEGFLRDSMGGAEIPAELDRLMRAADQYPGVVKAVDDFGQNKGDTIKFQRLIHDAGGLSETSRRLTGNSAISTTGTTVKTEEVPVVLDQFHGPYASSGSGVAPFEIADFDARYRANKVALASWVNKALVYDYTIWLDTVVRDRFRASDYITLSNENFSDVTSYVAGGNSKFSAEQLFRARKTLSDREWAKFPGGNYVAIVPTSFNVDMLGDIEYRELSRQHTDGRNQIFGYIGSLQDIDIFECSTTKQYAAASTVPGTGGGTVPASVTLEEGILLGPDAVGFGTAGAEYDPGDPATRMMGPVLRFADDTNYGTLAKCIWYAIHAFQTLDQRGIQRFIAQSA